MSNKKLKVFNSSDGPIIEDENELMPIQASQLFSQPKAQVERRTFVIHGYIVNLLQLRDKETKVPYREIITGDLIDERGVEYDTMEFKIKNDGSYEFDLRKSVETDTRQPGLPPKKVYWTLVPRMSLDVFDHVAVSSKGEIRELSEAFDFDGGRLEYVKGATNQGKIKVSDAPRMVLHLERFHRSEKPSEGESPAKPEVTGLKFRMMVGRSWEKIPEAFGDRNQFHKKMLELRWTDFKDIQTHKVVGIPYGNRTKGKSADTPSEEATTEIPTTSDGTPKGGLGV